MACIHHDDMPEQLLAAEWMAAGGAKAELMWLYRVQEEVESWIAAQEEVAKIDDDNRKITLFYQWMDACLTHQEEELSKEGAALFAGDYSEEYKQMFEAAEAAHAAEAERMDEAVQEAQEAQAAENHPRLWADMLTEAADAAKNAEDAEDAEDAENDSRKRALDIWLNDQMRNNPIFRTQLCRNWENGGTCTHGSMCLFAHGEEQLRSFNKNDQFRSLPVDKTKFKTKLCINWMNGGCKFGDRCHFAHGDEDLRCGPCA
jgi:hypothetical protein